MAKNEKKPSVRIEDGMLHLSYPVQKKPSKSGKSILVASTGGAWNSGLEVDGQELKVSLNAYISKD